MEDDLENIPIEPRQYIHDLFKDVTDKTGSPIIVSRLFDRFAPALFEFSSLTDTTTTKQNDRKTGYLAFYQSLSTYITNHYSTLSTAFLEHILMQATSFLPITKIATCLGLGDNQFDSCYENDDRLLILLGVLTSYYGSSAIDSFMHPLFEKHIFNEIQLPQPDNGQAVMEFEGHIRSRGAMDIYYQQLDTTCPQTQCRWECTITYRLGQNTSYLLHHRTGKNKKQAKLRTLHDIHNYYQQSTIDFFLPGNTWNMDHPHCHPHANITNKINTTTLSIPFEDMYEFDDNDFENTPLVERLQLNESNPNYAHIPVDDSIDPDECIAILAKVLLGSTLNDNTDIHDSPQTSPLPAATQQHHDDQPSVVSPSSVSVSSSPLPSKSGSVLSLSPVSSSSITTLPKLGTEPSPITNTNKQQQTNDNNSGKDEGSGDMNEMASSSSSSTTTTTTTSPRPPTIRSGNQPLLATEEMLMAKARLLMDQLTVRERCRMNDYKENLQRNPNDAKGCLMNLARKMEGGHYRSSAEHVQLGKQGTKAHYIATIRFGTQQVELVLARGHTKKNTAEALAALAIIDLLQKVSRSINTEMNLPFLD